jgi:fructose-1,6-bisphosphatase/inositol monophosphatase family enzyme
MGYGKKYGALLEGIVDEADSIAMKYYRGGALGEEKKGDGTVVTVADKTIEKMALEKVKQSGLEIDVVGEETSKEIPSGPSTNGRARI